MNLVLSQALKLSSTRPSSFTAPPLVFPSQPSHGSKMTSSLRMTPAPSCWMTDGAYRSPRPRRQTLHDTHVELSIRRGMLKNISIFKYLVRCLQKIYPCHVDFFFRKCKIYLQFLSFLDIWMVQVVEIHPHGRQGQIYPTVNTMAADSLIPGNTKSLSISNDGIVSSSPSILWSHG